MIERLLPFALSAIIAFGAGWSAAWYAQGVRHSAYVNEQMQARLVAEQEANSTREKVTAAWNEALLKVRNDKAAYERCVAAGRCSVLPATTCGPTLRVPPSGTVDGPASDVVPAATGDAGLASECEVTTLQVLFLQKAIREQAGYK
jgi:hypothetical protein